MFNWPKPAWGGVKCLASERLSHGGCWCSQLRFALLLLLGSLWMTGCHSPDKPESARYASVEIQGNTPGQIAAVLQQVFREAEYKATQPVPPKLVFEKIASHFDQLAYGSWVEGTPVWLRARVELMPIGEARYRLDCHAYFVRDIRGPLEEELQGSHPRRSTYQKMLDEAARRLQSQPPARP